MDTTWNKPAANRSMPPASIIPVLVYDDVPAAISWLCETFGFTERWRAGHHRAQLSFEGGAIVVSAGNAPAGAVLPADGASRHSLLVRVSDADAHYEHCVKQGANIVQEPSDHPYGERQYVVDDPGGHRWVFSQSIADMVPEDWGGTTAKGVKL